MNRIAQMEIIFAQMEGLLCYTIDLYLPELYSEVTLVKRLFNCSCELQQELV